ncbi:glycoside hydrolase family 47 protein [Eremomyces bilateralis CBS 781.70]|uniref:alpha-1,2-Mannosidase n=1 Tax=Eremomyces bilateralis CBS 781.70 TaxID=1392243 RepID=A0A6G1GC95_9PEZI|nr:glycoside hydrolase family 47 protein [Eremomyces bilateralis CBS 781.70]KAF1815469.1 glycoside hydrolase family 47 protein [Eremomyces bilateralis CBS 781.70]
MVFFLFHYSRNPRGQEPYRTVGVLSKEDDDEENRLRRPQNPLPKGRDGKFHWSTVKLRHPIPTKSMRKVPAPKLGKIPKIQTSFDTEPESLKKVRLQRLEYVKNNFTHAWEGYRSKAWLSDEVRPMSGGRYNPFGGWAATLVDSLADTLWIMGLKDEFDDAVKAIANIDFTTSNLDEINVFETTIRYLGGFLAASDLTDGQYPILLEKARELGDMLYVAFDTPNHMPVTRWRFADAVKRTNEQVASTNMLVAEIGSLTLEFTRLSQITGDHKYYDAVQRVMDHFEYQQGKTKLPGMWPVAVNAMTADFTQFGGFTIGGMADSVYEYLPKEFALLGGGMGQYENMYKKSLATMKKHIFFAPNVEDDVDILFPGDVDSDGETPLSELETEPKAQHLGCFAGGMVAIGSKIFSQSKDMAIAKKLVEGCLWGYERGPSGIMPEIMHLQKCPAKGECKFDEQKWEKGVAAMNPGMNEESLSAKIARLRLVPGVTKVDDRRYILRPEAIESIFVLYRVTGDTKLMDRAWKIFETIVAATQTNIAHAALDDCTAEDPGKTKVDRMESFWLAETLKYFYLLFAEPDLVSLDEYVLNTEAHPLKRPSRV